MRTQAKWASRGLRRSVIKRHGGKYWLAGGIAGLLDRIPHTMYAEPFCGSANVLINKRPRDHELINDVDSGLLNFFLVMKEHPDEFCRYAEQYILSREYFELMGLENGILLTDIQRAVIYYYRSRLSFQGGSRAFVGGGELFERKHIAFDSVRGAVGEFSKRLRGVVLENMDWKAVIKRLDCEECLFYLDPPYYGYEDDYGKNVFDTSEWESMVEILSSMKGKFVLSINDAEEVRRLFGDFSVRVVNARWGSGAGGGKTVRELLFSNVKSEQAELTLNLGMD